MRLTGALSNHDGDVALQQLLDRKRQSASGSDQGATRRGSMRPAQGAIQSAVLRVLGTAQATLGVAEIHRLVEEELGRAVSRDTVASFLSVACRADSPVITRPARGKYTFTA